MCRTLVLGFVAVFLVTSARADIYRWDNRQIIPGTEGIAPGPGVQLDHRELEYAALSDLDLTGAQFASSNLAHAMLESSTLTGADLTNANLTDTYMYYATLTNADFTGAVVRGARLGGIAQQQLYSTRSYQERDLREIVLAESELMGWNFVGQDLTNAWLSDSKLNDSDLTSANLTNVDLSYSTLTGAKLIGANLTNAYLNESKLTNADLMGANLTNAYLNLATLTNANLTGAVVTGARLGSISQQQLYSTQSYLDRNLRQIELTNKDLTGWNFADQDLTKASLYGCTLTKAEVSRANLMDVNLKYGVLNQANLQDATLTNADLTNASLIDANVSYATLNSADLTGANLTYAFLHLAALTNANLTGALVTWADFSGTTARGFTPQQLYATHSYQEQNLRGMGLWESDLAGWNLAGQNLTDADLSSSTVVGADLTAADLRGASIFGADLTDAILTNAIRPNGRIEGLGLAAGQRLAVRDDDGIPDPPPYDWLSPRPSRAIKIQDQMSLAEGGVLELQFDADPWDSLISFEPGIPVQLGGTLELAFADDVNVAGQIGRTFRIFDWTGVEPVDAFRVVSRYSWNTTRLYVTGEVKLTAVSEPATPALLAVGLASFAAFRRKRRAI